jgi:hypothetical protein
LTSPDYAKPGNCYFSGSTALTQACQGRALVSRPEEELHLNPNTGTNEFSLRDPDRCYVTISALEAA